MKITTLAILLLPFPALAEVSDKMPTITQLWLQGLIGAILLLLLIRRFIWASILGFCVVPFFAFASYDMLADPFVGPAIMKEQGTSYIVSAYGSVVLMFAGLAVGIYLNLKRNKNAS